MQYMNGFLARHHHTHKTSDCQLENRKRFGGMKCGG